MRAARASLFTLVGKRHESARCATAAHARVLTRARVVPRAESVARRSTCSVACVHDRALQVRLSATRRQILFVCSPSTHRSAWMLARHVFRTCTPAQACVCVRLSRAHMRRPRRRRRCRVVRGPPGWPSRAHVAKYYVVRSR